VVSAFADRFRLTARETEIVTLLVSGYVSVPKIASKLELSPNTVHNHFKNVFRRTGVNSKTNILTLMMHEMARTSLIADTREDDEASASV
jgi:DNA-binding CsgD family transcriptional regulator